MIAPCRQCLFKFFFRHVGELARGMSEILSMPASASSIGRLILRSDIGFSVSPISGLRPGGALGCLAIISPMRRCWTSPELRARQTAQALRLNASVQPALHECDYGRWAGSTLAEIATREPDAVDAWLRDPTAAPHGGEAIVELISRVATWLADERAHDRRAIAVTHPTIIRAAIVHAMQAPPQSFWRVDIRPLTVTRLSGTYERWNIGSSACAL
jgi:Histidine phosphatase superfamily (branch 1)